jgi:hypothetical protein
MSFQVATAAKNNNMVISVGPSADHTFLPGTDFGPDYPIYTLNDDAQYQVILNNPVCYLADDHQTLVTEVPAPV